MGLVSGMGLRSLCVTLLPSGTLTGERVPAEISIPAWQMGGFRDRDGTFIRIFRTHPRVASPPRAHPATSFA